jgi:hypothetical protein
MNYTLVLPLRLGEKELARCPSVTILASVILSERSERDREALPPGRDLGRNFKNSRIKFALHTPKNVQVNA